MKVQLTLDGRELEQPHPDAFENEGEPGIWYFEIETIDELLKMLGENDQAVVSATGDTMLPSVHIIRKGVS